MANAAAATAHRFCLWVSPGPATSPSTECQKHRRRPKQRLFVAAANASANCSQKSRLITLVASQV